MRVFLTELRRSPLRWWLPVLVLVDLVGLLLRNRYWIGVWPEASAAAQIPAIFLASAVGAAGAWVSGGAHRSGVVENIGAAARPPWQAELVSVAGTLTYGILAYLPGVVIAAVLSVPAAGPGAIWPGYVLLGLSQITLCAVVGHLAGRWARSPVAAPVGVSLGLYIVLVLLESYAGIRFAVLSGPVQDEVSASAVAARFAVSAGVLAVLLATPARWGQQRWTATPRRLAAAATSTVLLVGAVTAVASTSQITVRRPPPAAKLCTSSVPKICVWPEHRKYLPQLTAMARRLSDLPTTSLVVPQSFDEEWLTGRDPLIEWRDFNFRIMEGSMWSVSPTMAMAVLQASGGTPRCGLRTTDDRRWRTAQFEVMTWLEARTNGAVQPDDVHGAPPGVDPKAIGRIITVPQPEQAAWVEERLKLIRETPCA